MVSDRSSSTTRALILDTVTLDGSETNRRSNYLFNEFRIKLSCCNDNSQRPSTKSWTDKGIATSESVGGDQEISGRLKSRKTIKMSLLDRRDRIYFIAD